MTYVNAPLRLRRLPSGAAPTRTAHDPPGQVAGVLAIAQNLRPVDKDMNHTFAVMMRITRNRMILHPRRIKDGDIGEVTRFEITAIH